MSLAAPAGEYRRPDVAVSRLRSAALALTAVLACSLLAGAFAQNRSVVSPFAWPGLDIQYRELAAAQTLLDEGYGPDSNYPGEHVWYNPMSAWAIAAISRLTGRPASLVVIRSGPVVNLIAPAALFLLVAVVFDPFAAVGAVAAFVFLVGTRFPFYYSATYSPWFAPENFGQAFLYLGLVAALWTFTTNGSRMWAAAGGVLLGLTFLTHTAPAIVSGTVWVVLGALEWRRTRSLRPLAAVAVVLAVAFLVSLPFGYQILRHYRLHIRNPYPSLSPSDLLDLNELPGLVRSMVTVPVVVAALAFAATVRRCVDARLRTIVVWLSVIVAFLAANFARLLLRKRGVDIPPVIPPFHFFFYLMAIVAIGFGVGVRDACAAVSKRVAGRRAAADVDGVSGLLVCGVVVLSVVAGLPAYRGRVDFTELRDEAAIINQQLPSDLIEWIQRHTAPADRFLCEDDVSLYVVAPAGRKVVATNRYFSNPYVDWAARDADRREMFERLERKDVGAFRALAGRYGVRFVVVSNDRNPVWLRESGLRIEDIPALDVGALADAGLPIAFQDGRFAVLSVTDPPSAEDGS